MEWYGDDNGRVVLELGRDQVEVIGQPLSPESCQPVSRAEQAEHMAGFLSGVARDLHVPPRRAICIGPRSAKSTRRR